MKFIKRWSSIIFFVATIVCLLVANLFLTNAGQSTVFSTTTTNAAGNTISMRIFRPKTATPQDKAPAVVLMHGLSTTKESYSQYGIELARQGFVVILPDMLNHGDSDIASMDTFFKDPKAEGYGLYAAVRYAAGLDYVDTTRIGIAGHSMGGNAVNMSILGDNMSPTPLISSVYLISSAPMTANQQGELMDIYGARDAGVYYTVHDHVYFFEKNQYQQQLTSAQVWLSTDQAKSFVGFGKVIDAASVEAGKVYSQTVNGKEVSRLIDRAEEIHPAAQKGGNALACATEFFGRTLLHKDVEPTQIYLGYNIFSLVSLFMALITAVVFLKNIIQLPFFEDIRAVEPKTLKEPRQGKERFWFWVLTAVNVIFALLSVSFIFKAGLGYAVFPFMPQQTTNIYVLWALLNGIFGIIMANRAYRAAKKEAIANQTEVPNWHIRIPLVQFLKSLLISVGTVLVVVLITWIAHSIFNMDMRYYLWGIRNLPLEKLYLFFIYLPFYLIFCMAVSVAINVVGYQKIGKEAEWINDVFFGLMNMLPSLLITVIGYAIFMKTGIQPKIFGAPYAFSYMINAVPVFFIASILIRRIFKYCNNPYIPAIVTACILCLMQVASAFTMHTMMYFGPVF